MEKVHAVGVQEFVAAHPEIVDMTAEGVLKNPENFSAETVEKAKRRKNLPASVEMIAVDKMRIDIETAEQLYTDGMPYDQGRILSQIRFYAEQHAESMWQIGRLCLRLKAHEGHGGFMQALEKIGISSTSAHYAMAAVIKFSSNFRTWGNFGESKLRVLTVLDEPDIQKLADGGSYAGMTLDDVDRMTVKELREKLREERTRRKKDREAQETAIALKERKINELDQQLRYQQPPTKEQLALGELQKLNEPYTFCLARINAGIREAYHLVREAEKIKGVNLQQISEWLNQFDVEMRAFGDLRQSWIDEVDGPSLIDAGNYKEAFEKEAQD